MALQFWFGASGSGKSYRIQQRIIELAGKNPEQNYFMIVPDQFTMQTQKQMVKMHPDGGILNIDVLSFGRLSHRVFEEVGKDERLILDDTGKCLLLRKVAEQVKEQIPVLAAGLKYPGYIEEVKSILSEFMQYGLKPQDVKELAVFAQKNPPLHLKLEDLCVLYEAFGKACQERFITKEETLDVLCQRLSLSESIKGSTIVFDGFTGFTPIQNNVIEELLLCAKDVIVTLEMDHNDSPYRLEGEEFLFHLTRQTVCSLQKIAERNGISMKEDVILSEVPVKRFEKNAQLSHLERNLFRDKIFAWEDEVSNIQLIKAVNVRQECSLVCEAMFREIKEKGYRYRDIAVVTADMGKYEAPLRRQFERYGVPYFMDDTRSMLSNPFVAFLRNAISVLRYDFRYVDVFRFLHTGMTDFTMEEIDRLENYVRSKNIRGFSAWKETFSKRNKEIKEAKDLDCINETRQRLVDAFDALQEESKTGILPAKKWCEVFYAFCVEQNLQQKLEAKADVLASQNDLSGAVEYRQIYRLIMELFEHIASLLGEDNLSLQEFSDILDAGFGEIRIRSLPQGVDLLLVGDIERSRLKDIKVLFFLGVNDGNIPQKTGNGGLISDIEREYLLQSGKELAPTPAMAMFTEHLYLYMNLTKPSEKLYLSYAVMEENGDSLRPAYLVGELKRIFPKLKECIAPAKKTILSVEDAKERIAELLSGYVAGTLKEEERVELFALYGQLKEQKECKQWLAELTEAAFLSYKPTALEKNIAEELYGKIIECSVSSLEQFAACHYAHFLSYGLRLEEREEYGFASMDMGNVMHELLERFGKLLEEKGISWTDVKQSQIDAFVEETVEVISHSYESAILQDTAKNRYFVQQLKRIVRRTLVVLQEQLRHGTFRPYAFERQFKEVCDFAPGGKSNGQLLLKGRIDRIDTFVQEDEVFVKVVDYKSGNHSFDLNLLFYGMSLQLAVYLGQAVKILKQSYPDKTITPAAMLYYHTVDPVLNTETILTEEESNRERMKELTPTGAVSARAGVVDALDENLDGKSMVAPVTKKGCEIKLSKSVFDPVVLNQILDYAGEKTISLAEEMLQGKIDVQPMLVSKEDACKYCNFKDSCGFDRKIAGYEKGMRKEIGLEDFVAKMQKEGEGECQ